MVSFARSDRWGATDQAYAGTGERGYWMVSGDNWPPAPTAATLSGIAEEDKIMQPKRWILRRKNLFHVVAPRQVCVLAIPGAEHRVWALKSPYFTGARPQTRGRGGRPSRLESRQASESVERLVIFGSGVLCISQGSVVKTEENVLLSDAAGGRRLVRSLFRIAALHCVRST
ncbi:hypothetical protein EVAR_97897_1 [Eumeta japonica]|uniref:Uncharacterized protein n=1 Tax=Eumeta variegata TaxID=151549 RepID=A0A4C1WFJ2_EUMVA|nr:hypothetical protein EVAR_97897_1 [Eumeta japonica]